MTFNLAPCIAHSRAIVRPIRSTAAVEAALGDPADA